MSTTGNEIAIRDNGAVMPARSFQMASDLDSWISVVANIADFAEQICRTSFVPKAYRNDPASVAAAILAGRELGLPPMTALRHVQVVEGSPGLSAEYKRARVLAAGYRLDITEHTTEACTVTGHRKGHEPVTVRYTMADARRAGLVKPRGAWETRPRRMLFARASTEVTDALFSDLTNGLPTAELLEHDGEEGELSGYAEQATVAPAARVSGDALRERAAARRAATATAVVLSSREQFAEIKAHFDRLGIPAEQRGALISDLVGRDVPAPAELTAAEAAALISALEDTPTPGEAAGPEVVDGHVVDDAPPPEAPASDHPQAPAQPAQPDGDPRAAILAQFDVIGVAGNDQATYLTRLIGRPIASVDGLTQAQWFATRLAGIGSRDELEAAAVAAEAKRDRDGTPGGE